ncbi:MAG: hypothetical protein ACLTN0_07650 [Coprococcus phoceensis]
MIIHNEVVGTILNLLTLIAVRSLSIKEKIKAAREEARTEQGTRQGPEQGRAGIPGRR